MTAAEVAVGRPRQGLGHYLRDVIYGATDGIITTLAVIAGVAGAGLSPWVGFVLGISNLFADGLSMAVSNYLGLKSELEQSGGSLADEMPWRHALATWAAFVLVGAVPLLAFAVVVPGVPRFAAAFVLAQLALAFVGAGRARFVARPRWRCALEMMVLAGGASAVAYALGAVLEPLLA
jgi:VIT1/CCC1 family predicted Fe2+/Mn2+ transporter